ncbi:MAG: hypothetical protein ACREQ9_26720 [Candidatus Binatia bacterium]
MTVRGVPGRRIAAVRALGSDVSLAWSTRTGIIEGLAPDPDGELIVEVPPEAVDPYATVIAIDLNET